MRNPDVADAGGSGVRTLRLPGVPGPSRCLYLVITVGNGAWFRMGLFGSWRQLVEPFTVGLGIQPPLVPFTLPFGYLPSGLLAALLPVFFPLGFEKLSRGCRVKKSARTIIHLVRSEQRGQGGTGARLSGSLRPLGDLVDDSQ